MWSCEDQNVSKKRRKGLNKVVYTKVEGEKGFKQMFTHVLGFSNHKRIAWVFVQENKQSAQVSSGHLQNTLEELVFHSED